MKKYIVITIVILICGVGGVLFFNFGQSKMKDKNAPNTSETVEITEPTTEETTESTTKKTEGTTKSTTTKNTITKKTTTKKSTSETTKGTTRKSTTKSITKKSTTTKKVTTKATTTVGTTASQSCVPIKDPPKDIVWLERWTPDNQLGLSDDTKWFNKFNTMEVLRRAASYINDVTGNDARTEGGQYWIACKHDPFSFYGIYLEIHGYMTPRDENGNQMSEVYVAHGYLKPDGNFVWVYKNF